MENIIIKNGYNSILESCQFYNLKDEKQNEYNKKKAKIVLHLIRKNYRELNKHYNVTYMIDTLFNYIYN